MNLTLRVWRQKKASEPGRLVDYPAQDISPDMSFLEMFPYTTLFRSVESVV